MAQGFALKGISSLESVHSLQSPYRPESSTYLLIPIHQLDLSLLLTPSYHHLKSFNVSPYIKSLHWLPTPLQLLSILFQGGTLQRIVNTCHYFPLPTDFQFSIILLLFCCQDTTEISLVSNIKHPYVAHAIDLITS